MKVSPVIKAIIGLAALGACSSQSPEPDEAIVASAQLDSANGTKMGEANLLMVGDLLMIEISLTGLSEGTRAFHLHEIGTCEGPSFASAGGHLNPFEKAHGKLNEGGPHLGDLPNIEVASNGTFRGEFPLDGGASDLLASLFDEDGTAVMLHEGPDDYLSDPSGAAGPRLACGVLDKG